MEKITRHYGFDYPNDTTIEYVNTGAYSMLNCSFTSEDPDYGTDTLHFTSAPAKSMGQMAYEEIAKLTAYIDKMGHSNYNEVTSEELRVYGDYSNSTLYAIEKALFDLSDEYRARSWFGTLEDVCREVAKRIVMDGDRCYSLCESDEDDMEQYSPREYREFGGGWFGIKRLDPVFDNGDNEYIVAIGAWGGGDVMVAYEMDEGNREYTINSIARQLCDAFSCMTDSKPQSIVFADEEKERRK